MHDVGFLRAIRKNQLENFVIHRLFTLVGEVEVHRVSGPAAFDSNVKRTGLLSLFKNHVNSSFHCLVTCRFVRQKRCSIAEIVELW